MSEKNQTQAKSRKAVKLTRAMRGIPATKYRMASDGRKWKAACQERKQLADWLASYGDGDGTRIFPAIQTISAAFDTWSRATLFRRLADLRGLGVLVSEGLRGMRGNRIRRLLPEVLTKPQAEVSGTKTEVSDSPKDTEPPKSQIEPPKSQIDEPKSQTIRETHTVTRPSPYRHKNSAAKNAAPVVLPEWMPLEEWSQYLTYRKRRKKPFDTYTQKLAVQSLDKLRAAGHNVADAINRSILSGWLDFFPPRDASKSPDTRTDRNLKAAGLGKN
jgi:hypothetical protein